MDYLKRISIDPRIMAGKPCIAGTRIPVDHIVLMVGEGIPNSEILAGFPHISEEDIRAALLFAADTVAKELQPATH